MVELTTSGNKWTKTQLSVFFVIILLAIDEINPVKLVLHVISPHCGRCNIQLAVVCVLVMAYIFISDFKEMVYFSVKVFLHSMLSIFFRKVEIVGRDNIPRHGPVLFTVNHANQFMDAVSVLCTCQHKISYLMAEASWNRPLIGHLAWALDVVPVKRAQDEAQPGSGKIFYQKPQSSSAALSSPSKIPPIPYVESDQDNAESAVTKIAEDEAATGESMEITGNDDTKFTTELEVGDKIRPKGTFYGLKVQQILSDQKLLVEYCDDAIPDDFIFPKKEADEHQSSFLAYDILKRTPLNVVFSKVLERLAAGGAVGIFPEGGSHDRTDLLPLKVGVALIAYSALEQDGLTIPIVPVGLNYFGTHKWRGRAVVEYGRPICVDPSTLQQFKAGGKQRRAVCNNLLETIESAMRSVIVSTTDYDTLQMIYTARRLYQSRNLEAAQKQDLNRRFAEGYRRLLLLTDGSPPKEWLDLQDRLVKYRRELKDLGLKDFQVPAIVGEHLDGGLADVDGDQVLSFLQLPYHIAHLLILTILASVPGLLLNLPVKVLADLYAEKRRKKALAKSTVKIHGYDVMLTEKVCFCIVIVPVLWIVYAVLLACFTNLDVPTITLLIMSMPVFAYLGIVVSEAGMVNWQDLRPYWMRVFPSTRLRLSQLPMTRKLLQDDLRNFIQTVGPALGDIYYGEQLDWKAIMERSMKKPEVKKEE